MGKDFTVTIYSKERAAEWQAILGTTTVHVKSPIPSRASLPGHPNALIYMLDLDLITDDQRQRLITHIATKFDILASEVAAELDRHGVPILADDCVAGVTNPQKWF